MEKKLNILSATLVGLCVLTGSVVYSLVRSHHGFGDLSCEANATFNYFNSLDAAMARMEAMFERMMEKVMSQMTQMLATVCKSLCKRD